jgi:hypothetical protein
MEVRPKPDASLISHFRKYGTPKEAWPAYAPMLATRASRDLRVGLRVMGGIVLSLAAPVNRVFAVGRPARSGVA